MLEERHSTDAQSCAIARPGQTVGLLLGFVQPSGRCLSLCALLCYSRRSGCFTLLYVCPACLSLATLAPISSTERGIPICCTPLTESRKNKEIAGLRTEKIQIPSSLPAEQISVSLSERESGKVLTRQCVTDGESAASLVSGGGIPRAKPLPEG